MLLPLQQLLQQYASLKACVLTISLRGDCHLAADFTRWGRSEEAEPNSGGGVLRCTQLTLLLGSGNALGHAAMLTDPAAVLLSPAESAESVDLRHLPVLGLNLGLRQHWRFCLRYWHHACSVPRHVEGGVATLQVRLIERCRGMIQCATLPEITKLIEQSDLEVTCRFRNVLCVRRPKRRSKLRLLWTKAFSW
jgi:hypothetical protein